MQGGSQLGGQPIHPPAVWCEVSPLLPSAPHSPSQHGPQKWHSGGDEPIAQQGERLGQQAERGVASAGGPVQQRLGRACWASGAWSAGGEQHRPQAQQLLRGIVNSPPPPDKGSAVAN